MLTSRRIGSGMVSCYFSYFILFSIFFLIFLLFYLILSYFSVAHENSIKATVKCETFVYLANHKSVPFRGSYNFVTHSSFTLNMFETRSSFMIQLKHKSQISFAYSSNWDHKSNKLIMLQALPPTQ